MATIPNFDTESFAAWAKTRPACIKRLIKRLPSDRLYRIKGTKDRCTIYSYSEGGTVTVSVTAEYNLCVFERNVFGIKPEDLEECDLPAPTEKLGCLLETQEEIDALMALMREGPGSS